MASSSPSPLASSVEKTNGAKLSRLLIDGGTMVLRKIFDTHHPPANLQADLNANYGTLNNLLRKRVLHKLQWKKLFPPGGATPDSNTFDITLLFLLLNSICGLSPPPSGWHTKPSASDTSVEANLARIKFFRNELYGHVATTGVDTPTFSALWQEISAALVALGLPQAEIDRLKAEHCGEEDFLDVLFEWADSEEDIKSQLRDIKEMVKDLQSKNEILKKLAKIDPLKNIRNHANRYVDGTRLSFFSNVDSWLNDRKCPNRVMVISGSAGMGKSVISAVICEKMQHAGRLAGSHFCQHDRARHRNPKVMLQSLASQLCDILPEYKKALVEQLSRNLGVEINNMEVKDLFEVLFEEPLSSLNDSSLAYLMVIDGLDESEYQGRNELLDVIANYFQGLPLWIRFLVTTRPEINIAENLKNLHPLQLDPNVEENLKDIYLCYDKEISNLLQSEHKEIVFRALVQKSEGVMLYAYYLADFIKKEMSVLTPELLDSILPSGISYVYHTYFKRLETELSVMEDPFFKFLSAVTVSREPLPLGFVSKLLLPGKLTSAAQRKVKAAISCVSALLPVQDGCIHFFHKSVKDWLIDKSNYGQHHFSGDEKEGHEVLSELCVDELRALKRKGVDGAQFSDITKYALRHGVQHMLQLEDARVCSLEEVVTKFVLDVELVYAKLCVNVTAAFEDIVCVQKQPGIGKLQRALNTLLILLRKHIATLEKLPHTIFQTLCNEGGPELSSEALNLLDTRYSEMAYLEYLHNENVQRCIQAKFRCSGAVACFDVSPQLDYMVCECMDNTIQLWSLHTGKQLWKRDVEVAKDYYCEFDEECDFSEEPYRPTKSFHYGMYYGLDDKDRSFSLKSLYRSVVFHPTQDLVLPGILSHAYSFHGELRPLFPSSKCRFSVCSISADKTKMLTDCTSDAKSIIMWSLTDGSEINRFTWNDDIVSFALSRDGRLLAVSDFRGSICLLDLMDDYRTLAQTSISGVCGVIKFSPDCQCLYCFNSARCDLFPRDLFRLDVNVGDDGGLSLDVSHSEECYHPWKFESGSEPGFLLGDPFYSSPNRDPSLAFVLNKESVLRVPTDCSVIEMVQLDELTKGSAGDSEANVVNVVFSLNGDRLFIMTDMKRELMVWDRSSGTFKPGKISPWRNHHNHNLVAVREGLLLQTRKDTLELWDFELRECIRSWNELEDIDGVISISEDQVACRVVKRTRPRVLPTARTEVKNKVIIVDTAREGFVSTITIHGDFVACNSKSHVITTDRQELQMQCGAVVFWKIAVPFKPLGFYSFKSFSPTEQYCILAHSDVLYVLDVALGRTLLTLKPHIREGFLPRTVWCKFVSDEECVACFGISSYYDSFLQLFNVKSGDLLSEIALEGRVNSLAACPRERLVAFGRWDSKVNFGVLQVKLPEDQHSRRRKRSGFLYKKQSYNTMT